MTRVWIPFLVLLPVPALAAAAEADEPPAQPKRVVLAGGEPSLTRPLRYPLLPPGLDLKPGNAAPQWVRAGNAIRENRAAKFEEKQYAWISASETPLGKLPKKEAREFLKHFEGPLRTAREAARRERCDWELPPVTVQTIPDLPLDEVQLVRQVAQLLSLKVRLEVSEKRWDDAIDTLQTGFALARHVGESDTLIQHLVGLAIANIMLGHVEEWVQQPGAPNLYWSLTVLPSPFIDLRRSTAYELDTIFRSFPALRELAEDRAGKPLPPAEVDKLVDQLAGSLAGLGEPKGPAWQAKLALAALAVKSYPDAKKYMAARGRTEEEVAALPAQQVVLFYYLDQYAGLRDEVLQWSSLPHHQARPGLQEVEQRMKKMPRDILSTMLLLLMPAITKTHEASLRTDRQVAALRVAEALRAYAAEHKGQVPAKLADVTRTPLPNDPLTGKGWEANYKVTDGKAVFEVPPMPPYPASMGRVYELSGKR